MEILRWTRFILGTLLLLLGILTFVVQVFGVYKFKYVLNRMQAAAMGDTLGIGFSLIGLMILSGWNFTTLKLGLVVVFLWCSSPVSSHLISRLEAGTNPHLDKYCDVEQVAKELLDSEYGVQKTAAAASQSTVRQSAAPRSKNPKSTGKAAGKRVRSRDKGES